MPLYEFECIKCRNNVNNTLKELEKSLTKKSVTDLVNKYENINAIEVVDMVDNKIVAKSGKTSKDAVFMDFYLNEGNTLVLINLRNYRFSELIYVPEDEKNVKCACGEKKNVEKVISSFSFTSDLSTDMPRPDLSNLPPSVRAQTSIGEYIEEKDRPKKNR